jgi:hypothetical protein
MNSVIHSSKLTAPGRMDVVERIIRREPFFSRQVSRATKWGRKNRRGIRKDYSDLTVGIVMDLAEAGLDAVTMRRDEVIAFAFQYCNKPKTDERAVAA